MKLLVHSIFLLLLLGISARAQEVQKFQFQLAGDHVLTLPFEMSQNLIIIPVRLNQSAPMRFVLDTGINNNIITELTGVDTLLLNYARLVKVTGLGQGVSADAYYSAGNHLIIDSPDNPDSGIIEESSEFFVLAADQFELSKQLGIQVNGLIGSDIFNQFIVQIDPIAKLISFYEPDEYNFRRIKKRFTRVPMTVIGGKAYVDVNLFQEDGSVLMTRLLIDTGASLSFWVSKNSDSRIRIPARTIRTLLGQGLNGEIIGVNGRLTKAELGPFVFKKPLVSFPDSSSIGGIYLNKERHGSLGNDILRRFTVIMDFGNQALYLQPNKWFNNSFTYNKSGMEVEKPLPALPMFTIYSVIPGSPSALAGVMTGDVIDFINGMPGYNLTLDDINRILHGEEGKIVHLRLNREGETLKIRFRLENDI